MSKELELKIKTSLDNAATAKSLGDIKKSLKELKSAALEVGEGGKGFKQLTTQANELQDKLDDLKDSSKSLQGTGIEKLKSSFGLLTDSFKNADFGKAKMAFKGLGAAMKAIPIFLIIEGIMYLVENFDKLSKGSGFLGKALRFVGDIIKEITKAITWLLDKLGLVNAALDKQGEALTKSAEKAKTAIEKQNTAYDQQIAVAKAAGKETVGIEVLKQEAIIKTNKALVEQAIAYVRAGGKLSDEQRTALTEQLKAIKQASVDKKVIEVTDAKKTGEDIASLRLAIEDDLRKKELLQQEKAFKDNLKLAHGNADAIKKVKEDNNLKIADINFKYDKIDKERKSAQIAEEEKEAEAASEYLGNLVKAETVAKEAEINQQTEHVKQGIAEQLAASLERYEKEKALSELQNKQRLAAISIFGNAVTNAFKSWDSAAGNLGASITTSLTNAFTIIADSSKSNIEKITAGLQALSSMLGSINAYQNQIADEKVKQNEVELNNTLANLDAQKEAELNKAELTGEQKDAINAKFAQQEYELKVLEYNKNTEIKKKAFIQDQKLRVAQTVISTITGVVSAVTGMIQAIPGPVGIILGALAGAAVAAMGAIQVAQINKQKFDAGSPPQPPTVKPPSTSGSDAPVSQEAPSLRRVGRTPEEAQQDANNSNKRTAGGSNEPVRAYVVSSDVTTAQDKNAVIERRASF